MKEKQLLSCFSLFVFLNIQFCLNFLYRWYGILNFFRIVFEFIYQLFVVSPRYRKNILVNLLPNLGSNFRLFHLFNNLLSNWRFHLLPNLRSNLQICFV